MRENTDEKNPEYGHFSRSDKTHWARVFRLKAFTSLMNLPKPVAGKNCDKVFDRSVKTAKAVAVITKQDACDELRADSSDVVENVKISSEGTWQRQVFASLNGQLVSFPYKWVSLRF